MNYYTADWHLGEDRIGITKWVDDPKDSNKQKLITTPDLFYRPFNNVPSQDTTIINSIWLGSNFKNGDTLYHLGNVIYQVTELNTRLMMNLRSKYPDSKFILIKGNYDTDDKMDTLNLLFDRIVEDAFVAKEDYRFHFYLNHYPAKVLDMLDSSPTYGFGITGHIHGLWKVHPQMINVGVDAWHFKPVSETQLMFCKNAIENHYDEHVFPFNRD